MSLIKCTECGKEISDKASVCPSCGCPVKLEIPKATIQSTPVKKRKKGHGCLTTILIVFLLFCFGIFFGVTQGTKKASSLVGKYIDVTDEQAIKIDTVLKECGIEVLASFEHDELLDELHDIKGEKGYRAAINDKVDNILVYLTEDMTVYNIVYAANDLYLDGEVISTIQDYTFTTDEKSNLMIQCQSKVKEILKSPSTAKFPNILEWGFGKEKNIVTVQGYVDSQNGFGAEIRSKFQFIIDTDTNTIKSFIFDGQELIVE